ncbi:ABC transporter substrate-binding protein [Thermomonospora umbrina]|uniref:Peptide/nickel transport system substrate-binding protein n=1 Tax=Thermomonospora umbrina TaxID=111806 RepID=A0A3D9T6W1_9ACTN|nr:ABC transporter substrate-binding protein [Thermomonospora umbrina]REF01006.1 peptide/nickel transport system substrate-binding protein [Thermomonospora umbrina]
MTEHRHAARRVRHGPRPGRWGAVPVALVLCCGTAGCGGDDGAAGPGGTLRVVGSADPDHVDTAGGYSTISSILSRQYARTLFGFKASNDFDEAIEVRADVAAAVPTRQNGGISEDRRTYTIRLRPGVRWNTRPPREVTAEDFVRGIKRLCNPAQPSGAISYYTATIQGMEAYCEGYEKVDGKNARAMADYQNRHHVSGLTAQDARTLVVRLTRPANDFTNILAMQFAAAAPREYDRYIPDSPEFRRNTVSDGPYQITAYTANKEFVLDRNPVWRAATDPLRARYPARIQITLGQDSPETVQQMMEVGSADLAWDQPVPTSRIQGLRSHRDFRIMKGSSLNPYLVFNLLSPNNGRALAKVEVRRAIQYAIDKTALVKIYGGRSVSQVLDQVIAPGSVGHRPFDLYPTPEDGGDPARCRRMLAAAGHPTGLRLRFPYRTQSNHPKVAQSVQANLKACGIDATITPDTNGNFYGKTLVTPAEAREGKWDIAAPGWVPDWYGNNGRTTIVPLFDGRTYGPNSTDYGGYDSPVVNGLIDRALAARTQAEAAGFWARADRRIMEDAAIVPFLNQNYPIFHSARVENALYLPQFQGYDFNQIRLT